MNVIAIDVGTVSVRLAIVRFYGEGNRKANVLASCKRDTYLRQDGVRFEQRTSEIWQAICECCRECMKRANISSESIKSIAFSATCSLVVQEKYKLGSNCGDEDNKNDIIMWMDHRAMREAQSVTDGKSQVLWQFGGTCSPEFSLAKLIWLKKNDPDRFNSATGFYELPDWLVQRCIGDVNQPVTSPSSLCSVACKWGYDAENKHHCELIKSLGADSKIGKTTLAPGTISGFLSSTAASELGLVESMMGGKENCRPLQIAVGTSLIDAHSGMLAMLSVPLKSFNIDLNLESTFCSLAGTSSCHMLLSKEKSFAKGIWGPYKDVVIKDYYLLEAGQSLTGKLVEIIIESHADGRQRLANGERMYEIIESLNRQAKEQKIERNLHVLPTFHGNRSPLANPRLKGGVYGLTAEGTGSLFENYVATIDSIAYETRFIIERLGAKLNTILVSGGMMKNTLFMQTLADVTRCRVVKMSIADVDFMVMGSALVARNAALAQAREEKSGPLTESSIDGISYRQLDINTYQPNPLQFGLHEKRYLCYREFVDFSSRVDKILNE